MNASASVRLSMVLLLLFSQQANAAKIGDIAPDFSLPSLFHSQVITLSDYRGKIVYLDFWSAWCGPCRDSLPLLSELREAFTSEHFELVVISIDQVPADSKKYLKRLQFSHPVAMDPSAVSALRYGVAALPMAFLINRQGLVEEVFRGEQVRDINRLRKRISLLVADT